MQDHENPMYSSLIRNNDADPQGYVRYAQEYEAYFPEHGSHAHVYAATRQEYGACSSEDAATCHVYATKHQEYGPSLQEYGP